MSKSLSLPLLVLICVSNLGVGQERGFPILNSAGRFFGVGYTKGGYHSGANGQFPVIKHLHPASNYHSSSLQYPYHAGYQPARPVQSNYSVHPTQLQVPNLAPSVPPASEPKAKPPAGPAPKWLTPYLEGLKGSQQSSEPLPAPKRTPPTTAPESPNNSGESPFRFKEEEVDASPSDRLPGPSSSLEQPSVLLEQTDDLLDGSTLDDSNDLLDDDDSLLDDDDLLLLYPAPQRDNRTASKRWLAPTTNRYAPSPRTVQVR